MWMVCGCGRVDPSHQSACVFNSELFVEYKKCRLSDWLAILASQSESLHLFGTLPESNCASVRQA